MKESNSKIICRQIANNRGKPHVQASGVAGKNTAASGATSKICVGKQKGKRLGKT
jgi:hypothetical protein